MCGIAGTLRLDASGGRTALDEVRAMTSALAHRGPDGSGEHVSPDGRLALGHRRLAVIDLTETGRQPMSDPSGRYWIVFNGEIYDHRDLRRTLEADGATFRSSSDTEVLLSLLARRGPDALAGVRGMFALAFWDERDRSLLLARDRYGMKPLYVRSDGGRLRFASETRALGGVGDPLSLSQEGVLSFLRWGSVAPPLTWLEGVRCVEPGCWVRWSASGATVSGRFADMRAEFVDAGREPKHSDSEFVRLAGEEFRDSVRAHLVSDVPVALFLSGGIDSAALASAASSVGGGDVRCYTVAFAEREFSEEAEARIVAQAYGLAHEVIPVDARSFLSDVPAAVASLDQPTLDGVNSYLVARTVAQAGIKVVLSGAGGDERYGGYASFRQIPTLHRWGPWLRWPARLATPLLAARRREKWSHLWRSGGALPELHRARRGLFMPHELSALLGDRMGTDEDRARCAETVARIEQGALSPLGHEALTASVARMETVQYLGWQLLRDVDAVAMAHSLEVRLPFVDHRLGQALWPELSRHPGLLRRKRLLREGLERPLPRQIGKGGKRSFTLPLALWLKGELSEFAREGLDLAVARGWVSPSGRDATWTAFQQGRAHWSKPWALSVLGHLCEGHQRLRGAA